MSRIHILVLLLALVGCGGPAAPAPAPPPAPELAYTVAAADDSAVYMQADTAVVSIDAAGQIVDVEVGSEAILGTAFAPTADGALRVSVTFREFRGSAADPTGGTREATEADITGPLVFTLDHRGEATVERTPRLGGAAEVLLSPALFAATFFPRLPGRAVVPGDRWTDTVRVETTDTAATVTARSIVTYTVVGDSVAGGDALLLVRMDGVDERVVEGSGAGFETVQELEGTSRGWFLWDEARGLPAEIRYESELRGQMEVSAAPVTMGVNARSLSHVRLLPP